MGKRSKPVLRRFHLKTILVQSGDWTIDPMAVNSSNYGTLLLSGIFSNDWQQYYVGVKFSDRAAR
ncbi:MAG TPA: hypothetical protein VEK33_14180 [Terriglobales bacterium]|nr:hypothetical protein [Terriglobales bacterium]